MKKYLPILAIAFLQSCGRVTCIHTLITGATVSNFDSTLDSAAKIVGYQSGTNFQHPLDSTIMKVAWNGFLAHSFYDVEDWKITFYPRGITHTIKNIKYGNEKGTGSPGMSSDMCSNSITYLQDDSLISLPFVNLEGNQRTVIFKLHN